MSNLKETSPKTSYSPPKKLSEGTLIFFPHGIGLSSQSAGIIINEPTSHFKPESLEMFYVYDVFITSRRYPHDGKVMVVASTAIDESYEA